MGKTASHFINLNMKEAESIFKKIYSW